MSFTTLEETQKGEEDMKGLIERSESLCEHASLHLHHVDNTLCNHASLHLHHVDDTVCKHASLYLHHVDNARLLPATPVGTVHRRLQVHTR